MSLKHELEDLTKQQEILEQKRKRTLQLFSEERVIDQKTLRDQRAYYGNMIASHKATIDVLTDLEARQKRLSFSGGSSHFDRQGARLKLEDAKVKLYSEQNRLATLEIDLESKEIARQQKIQQLDFELANLKNKITQIRFQQSEFRVTITPWTGEVVETMVKEGDIVNQGQSIVSILPTESEKEQSQGQPSRLFVRSSFTGKKASGKHGRAHLPKYHRPTRIWKDDG